MLRLLAAMIACISLSAHAAGAEPKHGISMYGALKYGPDFKHFAYTNANAPKGGRVRVSAIGTFDSLNPFIIKGNAAAGAGLIYNRLMAHSLDEPFALYGELAQAVETPEDRAWVEFTLNPKAKWHDGKPVSVEDVLYTVATLKTKGRPFYRHYYANVGAGERTGDGKVRFKFSGALNPELPLIVSELAILPKHYWEGRKFDSVTLEAPLGSGPYRVSKVEAGRRISYQRVEDYWGREVPSQKGQHNFATLQYEYYRDATIAFEAFKAHAFDFRAENTSKRWAIEYIFPAIKDGRVIKTLVRHENTEGMQGLIFNTRRPLFKDRKVRQALAYAFDFEWSNKNLFYGQYSRSNSYFSNSELASRGLPDEMELKLLQPLKGQIPGEVFTKTYQAPKTGKRGVRGNLRIARKLLAEAGWQVKTGKLVNSAGQPFAFEILIVQAAFERIIAPLVANLKRLGIAAKIRLVDSSQYINRVRAFDYDMIIGTFGQSNSPGNEQRFYWSAAAADQPGSRNFVGIKEPAIDTLIEHVIHAGSRGELVAATRALDRVLLWGHYVIPQFHLAANRIAYWDIFGSPEKKPKFGVGFPSTWWVDEAKNKALSRAGK